MARQLATSTIVKWFGNLPFDKQNDALAQLQSEHQHSVAAKRAELEKLVYIESFRRLYLALDLDGPGTGGQTTRVLGRLVLVHAELVEIVVVGDVLKRGRFFSGGGERALDCLQLGSREGAQARKTTSASRSRPRAAAPASAVSEIAPRINLRRLMY